MATDSCSSSKGCAPGSSCGPSKDTAKLTEAKNAETINEEVKEYYGKTLEKSEDLLTNACTTAAAPPAYLRKVLAKVHPEVLAKYYGCGLVMPTFVDGLHVLDLGSGSGRDVYALSGLVGENGRVVGVDMTDEQLDVARKHIVYHAEKFGYSKPNVEFKKGYIEKLDECDLADNSFDLIVSNCVINLAADKDKVLTEAYRVLKEGGEMYFSDVYATRRVPDELQKDEILFGECISGALYYGDFITKAKKAGFADPRLVADSPITVKNKKIEERLGNIKFYSATYRLFKLPKLEAYCEDYGQAVKYKGTIPEACDEFVLDDHHVFETGKIELVCGNTNDMLQLTRFREHFEFYGNTDVHYGIFKGCGIDMPYGKAEASDSGASTGGCC